MALRWYVIHAYSGFENQVKRSLEERVKRAGLQHMFGQVLVPTEEVVEMREGQKRKSDRKFFPGYVLVQMEMNDETWHLVKDVPRVMGFIGGTSDRPAPITEKEAMAILDRAAGAADIDVIQLAGMLPKVGLDLQNDAVLVQLGEDGGDLPLAEGVVERVVDHLRRDPEPRRRVAIDRERQLETAVLLIARVNLQKVVYLTLLFVLTGFIGYAWPATLIETTWLSFITLNGPALLIIFRILPVPEGENEPQSLMGYLLTWGVIGAVMLILLQIVVQNGLNENLALSRTMVIVFAGIFNCVVLWDIYGVSPFSPP